MEMCPSCNKDIDPSKYGIENWSEGNDATMDCYHCGQLLLVREGHLKDFHQTLHAEDDRWPEDGNGTGWVGIEVDDLLKKE